MKSQITPEQFAAVYNDYHRYPHIGDVADALGISPKRVRNRAGEIRRTTDLKLIYRATRGDVSQAERGLLGTNPVLPGFVIRETSAQLDPNGNVEKEWVRQTREPGVEFELPKDHVVKGVSALVDQEGRELFKWVKTRREIDPISIVDAIKDGFADWTPPKRSKATTKVNSYNDDVLTLIPANDWHIGMAAWAQETGQSWNLEIAEDVIGDAIEDLISRCKPSALGVLLGGGDLLHSDSNRNRTEKSHNVLDVAGRYQQAVQTACRMHVRAIDLMLETFDRVIVRILPGNHDEHAAVAIAYFLFAWYRGEGRVTVDLDPSLFFYYRWGTVMLAATHGHSVKLKDMPAIMAHRRAEDWGKTRCRFAHGFHIHHTEKLATEGFGVICEAHQAPPPQDAWHFGSGFLSGRSLTAIHYHRDFGEIGRDRVAILDAKPAPIPNSFI